MAETLTRLERETIARFSEDPSDSLTFETFNKKHALRLIRDGAEVKRTATRGEMTYWTLSMPRNWFKWPRKPRVLSGAQLARATAAILAARSSLQPQNPTPTPTHSPDSPKEG